MNDNDEAEHLTQLRRTLVDQLINSARQGDQPSPEMNEDWFLALSRFCRPTSETETKQSLVSFMLWLINQKLTAPAHHLTTAGLNAIQSDFPHDITSSNAFRRFSFLWIIGFDLEPLLRNHMSHIMLNTPDNGIVTIADLKQQGIFILKIAAAKVLVNIGKILIQHAPPYYKGDSRLTQIAHFCYCKAKDELADQPGILENSIDNIPYNINLTNHLPVLIAMLRWVRADHPAGVGYPDKFQTLFAYNPEAGHQKQEFLLSVLNFMVCKLQDSSPQAKQLTIKLAQLSEVVDYLQECNAELWQTFQSMMNSESQMDAALAVVNEEYPEISVALLGNANITTICMAYMGGIPGKYDNPFLVALRKRKQVEESNPSVYEESQTTRTKQRLG